MSLRLMFFTHSLSAGGAERSIAAHIANLDRRKYSVWVCVLHEPRGPTIEPSFAALDVPIIDLDERRRPDPRSLLRLVRVLRQLRIDVLHSHLGYANLFARIAAPLAGVPVVVTTEQALAVTLGRWISRLDRWTLDLSDAPVFISEGVKRSFLGCGARRWLGRAAVIPNGVDVDSIRRRAADRAAARASLGVPDGVPLIGCVGRLSPEKGHLDLVRAFQRVRRELPDARLALVGAGSEEHKIRALVRRLGLQDSVLLTGFRADVVDLLGGFDAFAMPSLEEGLGLAALEAMAAGVPVVATSAGGLVEVVDHEGTGILVPPGDVAALGAALVRVLRDRHLARALVARAGEAVAAKFSIQAVVAAYDKLYRDCLESA